MIYIYEGCDGSGKSTKAQEDAKQLGCECVHNPVDWLSKDPYGDWLKFFEEHKNENICVDRSFIGNPIYRTWDNGYESSDFTPDEFLNLLQQDFVLIYCESGTEYEDATKRGEDNLKTKADYAKIKSLYRQMLKRISKNHSIYIYNWRDKTHLKYKSEE